MRRIAALLRRVADLLEAPEPVTETHHPVILDDEELAELLASSRQLATAFHPHTEPPVGEA